MSQASPVARAGLSHARAVRNHGAESPEALDTRRELATVKLETYVQKVVSEAPPLTVDQLVRISAVLRGGAR